jgi:hypothetical protein
MRPAGRNGRGNPACALDPPQFTRRSLETSRPDVFAIGDVRSGSVKRVAAARRAGAQPLLRSGRGNPPSPVARVESWPIPTTPCNVAACDCISHCATLAPVSQYATRPPWDDSNSDMLKDLAAGCAARRRRVRTASNPAPQRRLFSRERATVCAGSGKSEPLRFLKEMNILSAHQSSSPICPPAHRRSSTSRSRIGSWSPRMVAPCGRFSSASTATRPGLAGPNAERNVSQSAGGILRGGFRRVGNDRCGRAIDPQLSVEA